jgi:hypothetical protein
MLTTVILEPNDRLEHFIRHAHELEQLAPIRRIRFQPEMDDWGDIHRDISYATTPTDKVRRFLQAPSLERVQELVMHSPFDDIDAVGRMLAESPTLRCLARLRLETDYCNGGYFYPGKQTLQPGTQALLRQCFGARVSW